VIMLGKKTSDELLVKVKGRPKLKGLMGISQGTQAIKITGFIEKGEYYE